jgi:hypothetical protein
MTTDMKALNWNLKKQNMELQTELTKLMTPAVFSFEHINELIASTTGRACTK